MEEVHGVDVSWLHQPNKDTKHRRHPSASRPRDNHKNLASQPQNPQSTLQHPNNAKGLQVSPSVAAEPAKDITPAYPAAPASANQQNEESPVSKPSSKRPGLLSRSSSEKLPDGKTLSRRTSWLNSFSSKFSSSTPERTSPSTKQQARHAQNGLPSPVTPDVASPSTPFPALEDVETVAPYVPSKPKDSFFSTLTRRLSAGSQSSGIPKVQGNGGVCARRILNLDPNRERCILPELDSARLRKVSFCVDVEIAGGPHYKDDDENDEVGHQRKKQDFRMKERAEGEALKHPTAVAEERDEEVQDVGENSQGQNAAKDDAQEARADPATEKEGTSTADAPSNDNERDIKKREKKKRSEEERKERQEKRKRRAEENGSIPLEMTPIDVDSDDSESIVSSSLPSHLSTSLPAAGSSPLKSNMQKPPSGRQDRPTTDPVRIYRRCCQLRETPILKRITEQLMSPNCTVPGQPGVVSCLDLTHSRLQPPDFVTLGDWLAVVPVKQLKMEDSDVGDEGLRCVLAGLLAAKRPEPSRRKSLHPRHRERVEPRRYQERAGVIEKLNLKQNPKIGRQGFKHISLFIYMCRSIKAIDLSMNHFPETLPPNSNVPPIRGTQKASAGSLQDTEAAETFNKCLCERPGGSRLEELIVSECGLTAPQIRKIVDGAIICGVSRLGLAGNNIDDAGLEHVIHYIRSGVCQAVDLGSNDLRQTLPKIAEAVASRPDLPLWGLSLAACNLNTASTKALFPALASLPDFRFLDLSHNRDLCAKDDSVISLFRRYLGQFKGLKRVHLADVGMGPKQAIALADALPDGPSLAHLNILENKQLTALANARDEANQEEACALYASLMTAVRVSNTLICIDIDVPSAENNEIVKALAKQVVAYSLHNMEQFAIAEATGILTDTATAQLTGPHGGESKIKDKSSLPYVLMQLVGHVDGNPENHDDDDPAPDDDYIVGGTGVVKALQYVLGEKANDLRRGSVPSSPVTGSLSRSDRPGSSAGLIEEQRGKAKKMSKHLLEDARRIRNRLRPALVKEAASGDDMAYRRLLFLDRTLENMIQRFEEEYPETRPVPAAVTASGAQTPVTGLEVTDNTQADASRTNGLIRVPSRDEAAAFSDEDEVDDKAIRPAVKRINSDVSLASRALSLEEGHVHRAGQHLRREVVGSPRPASPVLANPDEPPRDEVNEMAALTAKLESMPGPELRELITLKPGGYDVALPSLGLSYEMLRKWMEQDPQAWEELKESQLKARLNNMDCDQPGDGHDMTHDA